MKFIYTHLAIGIAIALSSSTSCNQGNELDQINNDNFNESQCAANLRKAADHFLNQEYYAAIEATSADCLRPEVTSLSMEDKLKGFKVHIYACHYIHDMIMADLSFNYLKEWYYPSFTDEEIRGILNQTNID